MKIKKWKKLLSIALAGTLLFGNSTMTQVCAEKITIDDGNDIIYSTNESSGVCGQNLMWTLNSAGTLTISGTGSMNNYSDTNAAPWEKTKVVRVVIADGVNNIGEYAFSGCTNLTIIKLPDSISRIGKHAFFNCGKLSSVELPEELVSIDENAFFGCRKLSGIRIPKNVVEIGVGALDYCNSLQQIQVDEENRFYCSLDGVLYNKNQTELIKYPVKKEGTSYTVPSTVVTLANRAFMDCENLTGISLSEGITSIGENVFYNCKNLTDIELSSSIISIGRETFYNCSKLESIKIPSKVTSIAKGTFCNCKNLVNIELPEELTSIEDNAFLLCEKLNKIDLPKKVVSIGKQAFEHCYGLTQINVDEQNNYYSSKDGVLYSKDGTILVEYPQNKAGTNFVIPSDVKIIEGRAFYDVKNLTNVEFPDGLIQIGENGFSNAAKLKSVVFPKSLNSIGRTAFYGCFELKSARIPREVTEIGELAFADCNSELVLYCYTDTAAHMYAVEEYISYELLQEPTDTPEDKPTEPPTSKPEDTPTEPPTSKPEDKPIGKPEERPSIDPNVKYISNAIVTLSQTKYIYDGTAKTPTVTVVLDDKKLIENKDYTLQYTSNIHVGVGIVTITGIGNYAGTGIALFDIVENAIRDISEAKVTLSKNVYYYDGKPKRPVVTVKIDEKTLKENQDYKVSYEKNKNIGIAKVIIKGTGAYENTVEKTFSIKIKKGASYTTGGYNYKITGEDTAAFAGIKNKKGTNVNIPKNVRIGGKIFKVTAIQDKALIGKSKIKSITISEDIRIIGKEAFKNCKKLNLITIQSENLKKVGKNALKGIGVRAKIRVPSKKLASYKKLLRGKGQSRKVQIVKFNTR